MTSPRLPILLSLALAAALPLAPAVAAVQSRAELYDLRVALTDLDPLDGLAPSIIFVASAYSTTRLFAGSDVPPYVSEQPGLFAPSSVDIGNASSRATADVTGPVFAADGSFSGAGLRVSTLAGDSDPNAVAWPEASIRTPDFTGAVAFRLSANTRVSFTAWATTSVEATGGGRMQSGGAAASLFVAGADLESDSIADGAYSLLEESDAPGRDASSRALQVSFVNDTQGWRGGDFLVGVRANGFVGVAPPVPEPSTWALMLAGALGVAGVARRRRREAGLPAAV